MKTPTPKTTPAVTGFDVYEETLRFLRLQERGSNAADRIKVRRIKSLLVKNKKSIVGTVPVKKNLPSK